MRQCSRIIAQIRIFGVDSCGLMAGGGLRRGSGESAEFPTGVKAVMAMCAGKD